MKHPRHKPKTIRMTFGFLILSLWRRPRSRAGSCQNSCEKVAVFVRAAVSTLSPIRASIRLADLCRCPPSCSSLDVQAGSRSGDGGKDRKKRARLHTWLLCCVLQLPKHYCVLIQTDYSRLHGCQRSPSRVHRALWQRPSLTR